MKCHNKGIDAKNVRGWAAVKGCFSRENVVFFKVVGAFGSLC